MKNLKAFLRVAAAAGMVFSACAPQPQRIMHIIPLTENILTSVSGGGRSGSLARDGIEVSVDPLTRDALESYSLILKPLRIDDVDTLYRKGYVNYSDDDNRQLLEAYRLSGRYPYRGRYGLFNKGIVADGWQANPQLDSGKDILVFSIRIENRSPGKVAVEPAGCILLDGRGNRQGALRHNDRGGFASLAYSPDHAVISCGRGNGMTGYFIPRRVLREKNVAETALLKAAMIYPGVRMEGLVVFPMVGDGIREFSIVLPDVEFYDEENEVIRKRDFTYRFMIAETLKR